MFSGSYHPDDVIFLLKPVQLNYTPIAEKERLIQSGGRHYSEMLSRESSPSAEYLQLFHAALDRHRTRFARDLICLARQIADQRSGPITLVSLARAGTPVGALLNRILRRYLKRDSIHYSISLIRDRGIDATALRFILRSHSPDSILFVDGWTGKGVMARELRQATEEFQKTDSVTLQPALYVIADLSGTAAQAATAEDYLIPSSLLGATISGLVSRSILNPAVVGPGDYHGCVYHNEFVDTDLTNWFLETMTEQIAQEWTDSLSFPSAMTESQREHQRRCSRQLLKDMSVRFHVQEPNHVKPGIGEATRVMLRRVPSHLLLRDPDGQDVQHLCELATRRNVPVLIDPGLPYHAVALIRDVSKGDS
jgi:hypothetical protein